MAQALVENDEIREKLDYTWYLIKCSDPDGARENEGFQTGDQTPLNFCLNYYRTPNYITPDSCFPYRFGPLDLDNPVPETKAMMKLMDVIPFHFVSALHMMKWGGISYMVPHPCPELYAPLQNSAKMFNVFLRKRPGTMVAPGVMAAEYLTPARGWVRQYAKGNTNIEPLQGCNIYEYGQILNPDIFIMIPECCIWYEPRMLDDRLSDTTMGAALKYGNEKMEASESFLIDVWNKAKPHMKTETRHKAMMEDYMEPLIEKYTNVSNPPFSFSDKFHARKATVAEKIGIEGHDDLYRMFYLGGMVVTLKKEVEATGNSEVESLMNHTKDELLTYNNFLHENYEIIAHPIKNLVGMGIRSLLHSALYAKSLQR
jgi:hypothetical protein